MIAALAILRLVVDYLIFDLDLAGAEVPLEVSGIVLRVPKAELDGGEDGEPGGLPAAVGHLELPDFQVLAQRDEVAGLRVDILIAGGDGGIAQAVAAFVMIQWSACGLPGGRPECPALVVPDIDIAAAEIKRGIVVAVACQTPQARIPIERIPAGGVGDDAEVCLAAQVVDPRQGGIGPSDYVFAMLVVKMSVAHNLECGGRAQRRHRFRCAVLFSKPAWRVAFRRAP